MGKSRGYTRETEGQDVKMYRPLRQTSGAGVTWWGARALEGGHIGPHGTPSGAMPLLSAIIAQPPIRNMLLGVVRNGQWVDVATLPLGERWQHVGIVDVVRIDNVCAIPDASQENTVDGVGTR